MSGGVDSSVAAALLKQQGYDVTGVFMRNWHNSDFPSANSKNNFKDCPWQEDRESARQAAAKIGIPFFTWNFSKEYQAAVIKNMLREYRAGRTPNPDVRCNREIKFGLFLRRAKKSGADFIATGHYLRKAGTKDQRLLMSLDKHKDQSYFLWTLKQNQIRYCLFPIGDYEKPQVRQLARKFGLPNAERKDSQGLCFVGQVDFRNFLNQWLPEKRGLVLGPKGEVLGEHRGIQFYTIGQRHGLGLGGGRPYYIFKIDPKKNILWVTADPDDPKLFRNSFKAKAVNWISQEPILPTKVKVKIRYQAPLATATIKSKIGPKRYRIILDRPQRAVTSGQSVVFYRGQEMLGGGVIE